MHAIFTVSFQNKTVAFISIHPSFNDVNLYNDIALLHVESEFDISRPYIGTVCLPPRIADHDLYEEEGCFATGWGSKRGFGKFESKA